MVALKPEISVGSPHHQNGSRNAVVALKPAKPSPLRTNAARSRNAVVALKRGSYQ